MIMTCTCAARHTPLLRWRPRTQQPSPLSAHSRFRTQGLGWSIAKFSMCLRQQDEGGCEGQWTAPMTRKPQTRWGQVSAPSEIISLTLGFPTCATGAAKVAKMHLDEEVITGVRALSRL